MNGTMKSFLFHKHILVNETGEDRETCFQTVFALANRFGIRITKGMELATGDMIRLAARELGEDVPEPFFRGFPESVKALTPEKRLYDQLLSYALTYGLGDFSEARHSVFEEPFSRIAFREEAEAKDFVILTEEEAAAEIMGFVEALLSGSRPLNEGQFAFVCAFVESGGTVRACASRDTAVRLLLRFWDVSFARFLDLPDVIRLAGEMNYEATGEEDVRKLNLTNRQRKLIAGALDVLMKKCSLERDLMACFEKRALWVGLLHHIHYVPKSRKGRRFVDAMRNSETNLSAYSAFEAEMGRGDPVRAAAVLRKKKGSGALARNLNYVLSRCRTPEEAEEVLGMLGRLKPIVAIQMILQYRQAAQDSRTFRFVRFRRMKKHRETPEEIGRRKSKIPAEIRQRAVEVLQAGLTEALGAQKLGRVYIDDAMKKIALPLQEGTSSSGFGVLPRGSRLPMPEGRKIRCFTYWEKVDDIDLSAFGLDEGGDVVEFSWRTAWDRAASDAIVYSGDETAGYYGGSEYFDVDLARFREAYPTVRYVVFADNVFTGLNFDQCVCRAGYMIREEEESGQVYEPKTVRTAFTVDAATTYAVLFALDLRENEIVWLNLGMSGRFRVAGEDDVRFILPYMDLAETANVYALFAAKAEERTEKPEDADLIVSDRTFETLREGQTQIHSYDFEKLLAYLNG